MNELYDISDEGCEPVGYQLRNLGKQREIARVAPRRNSGYWDRRDDDLYFGRGSSARPASRAYYTEVTADDYDGLFASAAWEIKPVYRIDDFLNHHYNFYVTERQQDGGLFLKHIRYVIIPKILKYRNSDTHKALIEEWINNRTNNMKTGSSAVNISIGNNSTAQVQVNSSGTQQQHAGLDMATALQFFDLLSKEIESRQDELAQDLRYEVKAAKRELEAGNPIAVRLHAIGQFMKDMGMNVTANIIAAPAFELIKPYLGL